MRFLRYLKGLPEHLRYRFGPVVAERLVHFSTWQARRRLSENQPLGVLVDNTVLGLAVTHETAWISTGVSLWGGKVPVETGYSARIPVYSANNLSENYEHVTYLAGIAHLAKLGRLRLCTSAELRDERWRQPGGRFTGYGYFDHSLFGNLKIECIDRLTGSWVLAPGGIPLKEQQLKRINSSADPLFRVLLNRLGERQSLDAWHIRTAEVHGLYCFLTADLKLRRSVERWKDYEPFKSMSTKVLTPSEFGKAFGMLPTPPHFQSYTNASFIVRSDLHMPGERRRPVSQYGSGNKDRRQS